MVRDKGSPTRRLRPIFGMFSRLGGAENKKDITMAIFSLTRRRAHDIFCETETRDVTATAALSSKGDNQRRHVI